MEIGNSRIVLGQVVAMHVKDQFIDPAGPYIRAEELHAVGRMNGKGAYVKTRNAFFGMHRVTYEGMEGEEWRGDTLLRWDLATQGLGPLLHSEQESICWRRSLKGLVYQ